MATEANGYPITSRPFSRKAFVSGMAAIGAGLALSACGGQQTPTTTSTPAATTDSALPMDTEKQVDEVWNTTFNSAYPHGNEGMGCVALAMHNSEVVFQKAYGYAHYYEPDYNADGSTYTNPTYKKIDNPVPVELNTLFDLASVTKVMATTQSIMLLVDQKKLSIDDKVADYLPGFEQNDKGNITIAQLLTHSSGLPQWEPTYLYCTTRAEQLDYIKQLSLMPEFKTDGSEPMYSDFSFMTLGFVVEAITSQPMEQFVLENVYEPLGMSSTGYRPLDRGVDPSKIAATSLGNPYEYRMVDEKDYPGVGYDCTKDAEAFEKFTGWRRQALIGETNDGNAAMGGEGVAGHAGLYSTAADLGVLLQCMLDGGEHDGTKLYSKDTIKLFTERHTTYAENHDGEDSSDFGYGFKLKQSWMGETATISCFGHDGFTGTTAFADPDNNYVFVCLSNKMQAGFRKPDSGLYYNTNKTLSLEMNKVLRNALNI